MMVDFKDEIKKKKPILGLDRAIKKMRVSKVKRVYVSSSSHAKDKIDRLGKNFGIDVVHLKENSKELGVLCKKPFAVSVVSFE